MEAPKNLLDTLKISAGPFRARVGGNVRHVCDILLDAYRKAWLNPTDHLLFKAARDSMETLLLSLREHNLYPLAIQQENGSQPPAVLPRPDTLREDFENLRPFLRKNPKGAAEAPLMFFMLLLCRNLCQTLPKWYDPDLPNKIGEILSQQPPLPESPAPPPFSDELLSRYRTIRLLHVMNKLALLEESATGQLDRNDWQELAELFQEGTAAIDEETIPHLLRPAAHLTIAVFIFRASIEADRRGPIPANGVSVEDAFQQLRRSLKEISHDTDMNPDKKKRLLRLAVATLVRCMPYADSTCGRRIHSYLRSGKNFPAVHHADMFLLMPKKSDRLQLVNFLFANGKGKPVNFFVDRFEGFFDGDSLCLENPQNGFSLQAGRKQNTMPPSKLERTFRRLSGWLQKEKSS